jgi:hypothetical protein
MTPATQIEGGKYKDRSVRTSEWSVEIRARGVAIPGLERGISTLSRRALPAPWQGANMPTPWKNWLIWSARAQGSRP